MAARANATLNTMSMVGVMEPGVVHEALVSMSRERASSDCELGRWLVAAHCLRVWALTGYASFGEYVERLFGFSRRMANERLRVGMALETLPELAAALKAGELSWSVARELSRVALEESEGEWIAAARGKTARGVEEMVAGKEPGDRPLDRPKAPPPVQISFKVCPSVRALITEARHKLCAELGESVTDDVLLESMARALLGGAGQRDDGLSSYQIALTTCHRCRVTTQQAAGEEIVADQTTLECAAKAAVLATVLELLVAMGFKHREAQTMIDRVRTHVGPEASVEDALKAALHSAPTPPSAGTSRPTHRASSRGARAERRIPSPPERARERPLPA